MFAPGNIVVRLPWSLLLGLMMWYVLGWSVRQTSPNFYTQSVTELGINMLTGVTVLQVPLWIAKRAFRYRMIAPGEDPLPTAAERMQFQISHMLIGTLIFAIALSPLRAVLPKEGLEHFRLDWRMFVLVGVAICANLVATLPCLWGGFASNVKVIPLGVAWLLYCLVVTCLEFWALCAVANYPPNPWEVYWLVYLVNASQGAVVFAVMRCYRALGYRLLRVPREVPPLPAGIAATEVEIVDVLDEPPQTNPARRISDSIAPAASPRPPKVRR